MENIFVYSNVDGFTEIETPNFENYETLVSTMTDVKTVLSEMDTKNKMECEEKVYDCIETIKHLMDYYKDNEVFYDNLKRAKLDLELNIAYNTGVNGKKVWIDRFFVRVKELSRGVVRYGYARAFDDNNRYWHIFHPEQDIYEYNGRKFYMWDGWHSSLKVMKEVADRQFNF